MANDPAHPERSSVGVDGHTTYSEGIFIGYRWFDEQRLEPLYPFGYGLSYTHFDYSNLRVQPTADGGFDVNFDVRNAGAVAGDAVPQVYLDAPRSGPPGAQFAPRALVAFERYGLAAGEMKTIVLHVSARALQYWSSSLNKWVRAGGWRSVEVGGSSRDLSLSLATQFGG